MMISLFDFRQIKDGSNKQHQYIHPRRQPQFGDNFVPKHHVTCPCIVWLKLLLVVAVLLTLNGASAATGNSPAPTPAPTGTSSIIVTSTPTVSITNLQTGSRATFAPTYSPTATSAPTSALAPPACTLCVRGNDAKYVNTSKAFTVPGLLVQTCGQLLQTLPLFQRNSPTCESIRTLGVFCGCPSSSDACTVCNNGQTVLSNFSQIELPDAEASKYHIFGAPQGATLDCGTLDSAIHVSKTNDAFCQQNQFAYRNCCLHGQDYFLTGAEPPRPAPPGPGQAFPGQAPPSLAPSAQIKQETCSVCVDGSAIKFPNRSIQLGPLPVRNCAQLDTFSYIIQSNDTNCINIQLLGPYCGCTVTKPACSFCPNGEPVPFPNYPFPLLKNFVGLPPGFLRKVAGDLTCGEFQSILDFNPHKNFGIDPAYVCLVGQFRSGECGCSQGYQVVLVTWLFRASSILSLIGSFFIASDIIRKPPERRTTYHQLIMGTTCFDIITSLAYLFSGLLMPPPAYEAHGTHATCVLQGVMIQLGLTSLFYSVMLSIYYLLMIKFNWKESRFRKYRRFLHAPIIAVGIALTAAASTSIAPQLGFCYIAIPPEAANRLRITLLFVVPSSVALAVIVGCTAFTCYHVYSKERTTLKWSAKRNLSLTKKVCWQSFWYCIGFVVTIPCVMLNYYGDFRTSHSFWLLATASFFAPAQGFLNSLIYFYRASKGNQLNVLCARFCSCCQNKASKKTSADNGGSQSPGTQVATEPSTESQYQDSQMTSTEPPPVVGETDVPDFGRSAVNAAESTDVHEDGADPTPSREPESGPTDELEQGVLESEMEHSDLFSAAAAHWMMETLELEHTPSTRRPLTQSIARSREFLRSTVIRSRNRLGDRDFE